MFMFLGWVAVVVGVIADNWCARPQICSDTDHMKLNTVQNVSCELGRNMSHREEQFNTELCIMNQDFLASVL